MEIKILIVDDEQGIREILRDHFEGFGAAVVEACDGAEALQTLKKNKVHAVITDIKMPVMNGIELMKQIQTQLGEDRPRLYVVTGGITETDEKAIGSADGLLNKPFDIKSLKSVYQEIVHTIH